ncbi:zinc finger protein 385B isoform X2 [Rhinatrema bivittatum]|uniref:zinc finger protein 385B isoform X2 n=1 Tax=Rhinatrema bivittatum TaxID=194408 RepID=UPI00112D0062|nr:zinc finger protein 385B isoform X2 [Rhinatrema bivittatum]
MKRPLSPDYILENGNMNPTTFLWSFEEKGQRHDGANYQLNSETKRMLFSLCEVCNIQLNTAAQAQVHYSGKSHLKRMKQLNNGKLPTNTAPGSLLVSTSAGTTCHSTTLSALVRAPTLMMQPSLDIKPFMSFPVDNSPAVGLFPNFNTMDPVQKAVINHTFGVSIPPKKKQVISCNVCQLRFNSDSQAEAHYKGSKHAKKLKALEATKSKQKSVSSKDNAKVITSPAIPVTANNKSDYKRKARANGSSQPTSTEADPFTSEPEATLPTIISAAPSKSTNGETSLASESEEEKAKKLLYCSLCKVAVNSLSQLEAHNTGSKHKTMVEARNGAGPIKSYPRSGSRLKLQNGTKGSGLQNKTFHCEICDVHVNSEIQLKQHISSRRHKDRVAGKPMKPKYSPYNKLQRSPSILAAKLAFQKELLKPLPPAFLSSPLAAAVSSTLSLPPRPASLFQAPTIPPALLRPGHGPIRATPAPILFAPY